MRLAVLSDLHLEFYQPAHIEAGGGPVGKWHVEQIAAGADLVVLAGDIHKAGKGVSWAAASFPHTPVLYVLGNHEPYGREIGDIYRECRARAEGTSVKVLENEEVEIGGVRFLGCTLWTDLAANGTPRLSEEVVWNGLNDYRQIRINEGERNRRLQPGDTRAWHQASRAWLRNRLAERPAVVVTHHGPHMNTQPPRFRYGDLAPGFTSDLTSLMGPNAPLWICGHTHFCCDFEIGGTRIVSNQAGYPHESVPGFDPTLWVEVPFRETGSNEGTSG